MGQAPAWPRTENAAPDDGHGIFFDSRKHFFLKKEAKTFVHWHPR